MENEAPQAYKQSVLEYHLKFAKIASMLALVLVPAGSSLEYFIYPNKLFDFFILRMGCDAVIAVCFFLYFTEFGKLHGKSITLFWALLIQVMISYMIYATEGANSTYYAGLNLVILSAAIVLPLSMFESLALCIGTLSAYLAACYAHTETAIDIRILYNNVYFITLTSIVTIAGIYFLEIRRVAEFYFSYSLGAKNQKLSELDRLKSEFFANASHELRTPLTLILAPVEDLLTRTQALPTGSAELLKIIHSNALRLLKLVNDLLDINRLEEGKFELQPQVVDFNQVVAGLLDAMGHLAETHGLNLQRKLDDQPLLVYGDLHALEKVIVNLLGNAIKFTDAGGVIVVTTYSAEGMACLDVKDSGIGIAAADLPHIFDRFHQADGSATRRYQGTGLGLALVKELVEKQNGTVQASSLPGMGTTMTVALPLVPVGSEAATLADRNDEDGLLRVFRAADRYVSSGNSPDETSAFAPTPTPLPEGKGLNVPLSLGERVGVRADGVCNTAQSLDKASAFALTPTPLPEGEGLNGSGSLREAEAKASLLIVDDEPDMRRYLVDALCDDFCVIQAGDGMTGLALAQHERPALVLLDLMMPGMDGMAVCRAIREDQNLLDCKVILLTARVDESIKLAALDAGADDFLTKPFSRIEVQTRLRNLARSVGLQRGLRQINAQLQEALDDLHRTRDQLLQSEKLNAIGVLTAGLLHEINNPLNYAHTTLQVLLENPAVQESAELLRAIERVRHGVDRVLAIANNLRTFVRPSVSDLTARFSLSAALETARSLTVHEMKGIEFHDELAADCWVLGARDHIERVLINLLSNAAKAVVGRQPGIVRVSTQYAAGRVLVRIWDNGKGIAAADLPKVFDPFFTTAEVGQGMGLGLSICHSIIAYHGGCLRVTSQQGEWTEFVFDLAVEHKE